MMNPGKDVALESLDHGFQESKNMQLMLFLNDQAEISNRLKTCLFKENSNNNGVLYAPVSRVSTAPETATRTHRLRPLSARPSTTSGRQYQEPEADRKIDFDNLSVSGRRKSAVRRQAAESSSRTSSSSSPTQRPETVCGFYDLTDVEEESDEDLYDVESDLDVLSIESITSTTPCDDIDDEELDGLTYEFDVPESDMRHIEVETREHSEDYNTASMSSVPTRRALTRRHTSNDMGTPTPMSSPTRVKSSKNRKSMPNIGTTSVTKTVIKTYSTQPHPPNGLAYEPSSVAPETSSTSTVLRHMRTRLSSTELKDRGRVHNSYSKGVVWGDSNVNDNGSSSHHFRSPSDRSPLAASPMSPRISFEEIPIERQGMSLRAVARIECDASFYRKLRHRSAPAMRTDELTTSRSGGNSPVRAKPIGIYHLPPLSKETSPTSSAHSGGRTLPPSEFLAQQMPQHKAIFQEPNLLH